MKTEWLCKLKIDHADHVGEFVSECGELFPGTYVKATVGYTDIVFGRVINCRKFNETTRPEEVIGTIDEIVSKRESDSFFRAYNRHYIDRLFELIEAENWVKLLRWACDNSKSDDERISNRVIACYRLCIDHDLPIAAYHLARSYYYGVDIERNLDKAIKWSEYAADKGVKEAFSLCIDYYINSDNKDCGKAYYWALLGALSYDIPECYYQLGKLKESDLFINRSVTEAIAFYEKALELIGDDPEYDLLKHRVQNRLALAYLREGKQGKNPNKAYMLFAESVNSLYESGGCDFQTYLNTLKENIAAAEACL